MEASKPMEIEHDDNEDDQVPSMPRMILDRNKLIKDFVELRDACQYDWSRFGENGQFALLSKDEGTLFPPIVPRLLDTSAKEIAGAFNELLQVYPIVPCMVHTPPLIKAAAVGPAMPLYVDAVTALRLLRTMMHIYTTKAEDAQNFVLEENKDRRGLKNKDELRLLYNFVWARAKSRHNMDKEKALVLLTMDLIHAVEYNIICYINLPPGSRKGMLSPMPVQKQDGPRLTAQGQMLQLQQRQCDMLIGTLGGQYNPYNYITNVQLAKRYKQLQDELK